MAQDLQVTLSSVGPGALGIVNVDLLLYDWYGTGQGYNATLLNPSAGTTPGSGRLQRQNAEIMGGPKTAWSRLTPIAGVVIDVNSTNLQNLFTLPTNIAAYPINGCVIGFVVVRAATLSLSTVSMAFGWNASGNNVISTATHTELTGATLATVLTAGTGQVMGTSGGSFGIKNSIAQGAPGNATIDVFGYIF